MARKANYKSFEALGIRNLAASANLTFSQQTFAESLKLPFPLLSDPDGKVRATFEIVTLSGWAPAPDQPKPLRPGSAKVRLADALGVKEHGAGEKAPGKGGR